MWITLVGFNAAGKTTLARRFGRVSGRRMVDLDQAVRALAGASLTEIFEAGGPQAFREFEFRVVAELPADEPLVLACGGGTVERRDTIELVRARGPLVWLDAPWPVLRRRLAPGPDATPAPVWQHLGEDGLAALFARRRPLFAAAADLRLDSDRLDPSMLSRRLLARALQWDEARREAKA